MGKLRIVIVDRDGHALAARVSVSGPDGRAYAPDDAWRHADEAFDRAERPFEYSYFHTAGTADVTVPAGGGAFHLEGGQRPGGRLRPGRPPGGPPLSRTSRHRAWPPRRPPCPRVVDGHRSRSLEEPRGQ